MGGNNPHESPLYLPVPKVLVGAQWNCSHSCLHPQRCCWEDAHILLNSPASIPFIPSPTAELYREHSYV